MLTPSGFPTVDSDTPPQVILVQNLFHGLERLVPTP